MFTLQKLATFFLATLATQQLVQAAPAEAAAADASELSIETPSGQSMTLYFKGVHFDNATGEDFKLYSFHKDITQAEAFAEYLHNQVSATAANTTSALSKRNWYNCQFPEANYIQEFCCNTGHALGGFISSAGAATGGGIISSLVTNAINGRRDNQKPRSICASYDGKNVCTSWATYSLDKATSGEISDITRYSVQCAQSGGSAEFKTEVSGGGLLYVCVSDRADGCGQGIGSK